MLHLATGIFMWYGPERQTDRYGAFFASPTSFDGLTPKAKVFTDVGAVNKFVGQRVRIVVKVIENRPSGHIGDAFHNLSPYPLAVGKELELAIGTLEVDQKDGFTFLVIRPDDGRREFWIDPRKFFQLHDQTVEIHAELSSAPAHAVFKGNKVDGDESISNGDGTLQTKTKTPMGLFAAEPTIEAMGGGMFSITPPSTKAGARNKLVRR